MDFKNTGSLQCAECRGDEVFIGTEALLKHYHRYHGKLSHYVCGQLGCRKSLLHLTSLIRHIKSYHQVLFENEDMSQNPTADASSSSTFNTSSAAGATSSNEIPAGIETPEDSDTEDSIVTICLEEEEEGIFSSGSSLREDLERAAVEVLLGLRSTASLTGEAIVRFQTGCTRMIKQYNASVKANISSKLMAKGLSADDVCEILSDLDSAGDPFKNLKTIDNQLDYFEDKFGLVQPQEKFLDTRIDKKLDPVTNSYVPAQVKETFQYIYIIKTLTAVLRNKKIRDFIMKNQASTNGNYRSYEDGSHCKEHPVVQKYDGVIQILLFYDELEVANALGSKTIIHKLATFFIQILNLPPELSSQLSSIYLLALAHADDLKKDGAMEKVLTLLVHEMKRLSSDEGVEIELDGETFTLRAVLVALTADTPAAHDVLGFLGVGANYFCRKCLVSREEVRRDANIVGEERTLDVHERHILEVARRPKFSKQCGVKRGCPLSKIPYFDPTSSSVFDAFHDLLEGVAPLMMKLVLRHYIFREKFFTVKDLNLRVASFSYGIPDSKNKPSATFTETILTGATGKLKQTGSQMWCLMRVLPFLIGDKVPESDPHMKQLFLLQDIMQIIFAFEFTSEDIDRLDALISEHNEAFMRLFIHTQQQELDLEEEVELDNEEEAEVEDTEQEQEEVALEDGAEQGETVAGSSSESGRKEKKLSKVYVTNKLHHLRHYPEMFRKYGPVVRMWCAKFEGTMKIFRQHASICCNFKNPPMTMAKMFQLSNLRSLLSSGDEKFLDYHKGTTMKVSESPHQGLLNLEGLADTVDVVYTNSATVYGQEYRPSLFVCLQSLATLDPSFALITDVVVASKTVVLILKPWRNVGLSSKYNAFKVIPEISNHLMVKKISVLGHYRCIAPWSSFDTDHIYLSMRTVLA